MKAKGMFIFIAGVVVGACGGYFAANAVCTKKHNKILNEELDAIRRGYPAWKKGETVAPSELEHSRSEEKDVDISPEMANVKSDDLEKYTDVLKRTSYSYVREVPETTMLEEAKKEAEELIEPAKNSGGKFTKKFGLISADAFYDSDNSVRLIYYSNGVLADEDDIIIDPKETVSVKYFKEFKETYDPIYIHNFVNDIDYMIEFSNAEYDDGGSEV